MTREEFEQLLKANNIVFVGEAAWRVAQLVAAAEREACAKVCEETTASWTEHLYNDACVQCAQAIRARGKE